MRKSHVVGWVVLFACVLFIGSVVGATGAKPELPVLITSIGQSAEVLTAGVLAERAGLEPVVEPLATAADLDGVNTLILSVGVSLKGFGAAGIDRQSEEARAAELLAAAKEQDVYVIVLFIGGTESRDGGVGPLTMNFVQLTAPEADLIIYWDEANPEGYFTTLSEDKDIPVVEMRQVLDLPNIYTDLFEL